MIILKENILKKAASSILAACFILSSIEISSAGEAFQAGACALAAPSKFKPVPISKIAKKNGVKKKRQPPPGCIFSVFDLLLREDRAFTFAEIAQYLEVKSATIEPDISGLVNHLGLAYTDTISEGGEKAFRLTRGARANAGQISPILKILYDRYGARPRVDDIKSFKPLIDWVLAPSSDSSAAFSASESAAQVKDLLCSIYAMLLEADGHIRSEKDPETAASWKAKKDSILGKLCPTLAVVPQFEDRAIALFPVIIQKSCREETCAETLPIIASHQGSVEKAYLEAALGLDDPCLRAQALGKIAYHLKRNGSPVASVENVLHDAFETAYNAKKSSRRADILADILVNIAACGLCKDFEESIPTGLRAIVGDAGRKKVFMTISAMIRETIENSPSDLKDLNISFSSLLGMKEEEPYNYAIAVIDAVATVAEAKSLLPPKGRPRISIYRWEEGISSISPRDALKESIAIAESAREKIRDPETVTAIRIYLECASHAAILGREKKVRSWLKAAEECARQFEYPGNAVRERINIAAAVLDAGLEKEWAMRLFNEAAPPARWDSLDIGYIIRRLAPYGIFRKHLIELSKKIVPLESRIEAQCAILTELFKCVNNAALPEEFGRYIDDQAKRYSAVSADNEISLEPILTDIQIEDIARIEAILRLHIRKALKSGESYRISARALVKSASEFCDSDHKPLFIFYQIKVSPMIGYYAVLCETPPSDLAPAKRRYCALFPEEAEPDCSVPIHVYTEDEYDRFREKLSMLTKPPERKSEDPEGAQAISRYVRHELAIDQVIRHAHKKGLAKKPVKSKFDYKSRMLKLLEKYRIKVLNPGGLVPIEDRELYLIKATPEIKDMIETLPEPVIVDELGDEHEADGWTSHSSNHYVHAIVSEEDFNYLTGEKYYTEDTAALAALRLEKNIGHEAGAMGDLPVTVCEISGRKVFRNEIDDRITSRIDGMLNDTLPTEEMELTIKDLDKNLTTRDYVYGTALPRSVGNNAANLINSILRHMPTGPCDAEGEHGKPSAMPVQA